MKRVLFPFLIIVPVILTAQDESYYEPVTGLTGKELKSGLHDLIRNHKVFTYESVKSILPDLDEDPDNTTNIILFYSRRSQDKDSFGDWNREHVWPKSHGFPDESDTAYTDLHHLRPADGNVNEAKGAKDFNLVPNIPENEVDEAPGTYTDDDFWEPADEVKGDVARMLFYMDVRYDSKYLDLTVVDRESYVSDPHVGVLYTLLKWHTMDPVSEEERNRNNKAFGYQENRNPFIDHPEWVDSIWGNPNEPLILFNFNQFNTDFGKVSEGDVLIQSYTINNYQSASDIDIEVEGPFELSLSGQEWSGQLSVTNLDSMDQTKVWIRFAPVFGADTVYHSSVIHRMDGKEFSFHIAGEEGIRVLQSIAEAREVALGESVYVTGVVIDKGNNSSNNRVIYDGTAGIMVRSFDEGNETANFGYGDSLTVIGGLSEYNDLLQIELSPLILERVGENGSQPEPQLKTLAEIGEDLESQLVRVDNVAIVASGTFRGGGSAGNFLITDGTGTLVLRIGSENHPLVGTPIPGGRGTLIGIVGQYQEDYQISPRDETELIFETLSASNEIRTFHPNPASDHVYVSESVDHYKILTLSGQEVAGGPLNRAVKIDLDQIPEGLYLIQVVSGKTSKTHKLVIRR